MSLSSGNPKKNDESNSDHSSMNRGKYKSSGLLSSLLSSMQKPSLPQIPRLNSVVESDLLKKKGSIRPEDVLKLKRYTESIMIISY
jgi:hypothetical protein